MPSRRAILQTAAGLALLGVLPPAGNAASALKPMTGGAKPISLDELRTRLAKVQDLMANRRSARC